MPLLKTRTVRKLGVLTVVLAFGFVSVWIVGGQLSASANRDIGQPPPETPFETVVYNGVHGWFLPAEHSKTCLLLMHGIRSNRLEMVGRSLFFERNGYPSFAIDLQGHGESPGDEITYGYRESDSARTAVSYLRQNRGCDKVVALGSSLGGAAALLGVKPLDVDGYILEAVYPDIETAVRNRLRIRIGTLGDEFAPLLYEQIPLRLDIGLSQLQPAKAIRHIHAPVLLLNGTEDRRTTRDDALRLYENAPEPKKLIWFDGAQHTNLYEYDRSKYEKVVLGFLKTFVDRQS